MKFLDDFLFLIFPDVCAGCGNPLNKGEEVICTFCEYHLPETNFHFQKDNPVYRKFWGRTNITQATAMYFFNKASKLQHLMHELKYKGKKEVGIRLGKILGQKIKETDFKEVDLIIPVPLHPSKERKRGYNQSDMFAQGLSEGLQKPWSRKILKRKKASESQTKKSRMERWKNVDEIFEVTDAKEISNKHLLLVDDVITTGATLESCANALLQIQNTKVSIATLATAQH